MEAYDKGEMVAEEEEKEDNNSGEPTTLPVFTADPTPDKIMYIFFISTQNMSEPGGNYQKKMHTAKMAQG